jgi:uncharacterized protein DUF1236
MESENCGCSTMELAACPSPAKPIVIQNGTPCSPTALVLAFALPKGKEAKMQTHYCYAAAAFMLLAGTGTATAQTYYAPGPAETVIDTGPLQLSLAQRTTIYRTIVPQGRGRAPIVREKIVTEPVAPVVQAPVAPPVGPYAYDYYGSDYAYVPAPREYVPAPRERIVAAPGDAYAYAVGSRVPPSVRLAPLPPAVVAEVPAVRSYRYMRYFDRVLLVDPVTSTVVADVTGY